MNSRAQDLFSFPNPVNETSARVVAAGVVAMAGTSLAARKPWLMIPLAYGFAARVLTGPTASPLGQLATRIVTPRLPVEDKFVPGAPKRLAQGMGLAMSGAALALHYGLDRPRAARVPLAALLGAAALEAGLGICLACKMFPVLVKVGLADEADCPECSDVSLRTQAAPDVVVLPAT